jgi:excisionase family DNA binding protein
MDAHEHHLFERLLSELARLRTALETHHGHASAEVSTGPAVLTVREACAYLNTPKKSLYAAIKREAIPFRRLGRKIIFRKAELDTWLATLPGVSVEQATAIVQAQTVFVTQTVRIEPPAPTEAPTPWWPQIPRQKPPPRLDFQRRHKV